MKRVLLAVGGLSPQIITETLYALAVRRRPAFIPDEIHLATTGAGADCARLQLLSDPPGWFHRLRHDYDLPDIRFDEEHIHILRSADGSALADIRTPEDNEAAADGIIDLVRRLTSDPDTALHVSIAGGRKTMGFFVGYALSLFGREQDRLSHVLVSEPYEGLRDFFYPAPNERIIYTRGDLPVDASKARVWLAEIPFVRMREGIPEALRMGKASYSEVVRAAGRRFDKPCLRIAFDHRRIHTHLGSVPLPPVDLAFYAWLARLRREGDAGIPCPAEGERNQRYAQGFRACLDQLTEHGLRGHDGTRRAIAQGMDKAYFEQRKTRINRAIRLALGTNGSPYEIQRVGKPGHFRFGLLALKPSAIEVPQ